MEQTGKGNIKRRVLYPGILSIPVLCIVGYLIFVWHTCHYPPTDSVETVIPEDARVTVHMERTMCFGSCPAYTVDIYSNGDVIFNGDWLVDSPGLQRGKISQARFDQLMAAFEEYNFYRLAIEYKQVSTYWCMSGEYWSDAQTVITMLSVDGHPVTIEHYYGLGNAPADLEVIEDLIDAFAETDKWVK